ncbi:MAG: hypothetical protein GXN99_01210, partial [Candidatus Nanohaloarchaeota archaeon]|nr:hypothetical protein [Candidatus Nanohaloarchaeota archaeon]
MSSHEKILPIIVPQHGIKKVYELNPKIYPGIEKWLFCEYAPTEESLLRALAAYSFANNLLSAENENPEIYFTGGTWAGKNDKYGFGAQYLAGIEVQKIWENITNKTFPENIKVSALPGENLYVQVKNFLKETNFPSEIAAITSDYHLPKLLYYLAKQYQENIR